MKNMFMEIIKEVEVDKNDFNRVELSSKLCKQFNKVSEEVYEELNSVYGVNILNGIFAQLLDAINLVYTNKQYNAIVDMISVKYISLTLKEIYNGLMESKIFDFISDENVKHILLEGEKVEEVTKYLKDKIVLTVLEYILTDDSDIDFENMSEEEAENIGITVFPKIIKALSNDGKYKINNDLLDIFADAVLAYELRDKSILESLEKKALENDSIKSIINSLVDTKESIEESKTIESLLDTARTYSKEKLLCSNSIFDESSIEQYIELTKNELELEMSQGVNIKDESEYKRLENEIKIHIDDMLKFAPIVKSCLTTYSKEKFESIYKGDKLKSTLEQVKAHIDDIYNILYTQTYENMSKSFGIIQNKLQGLLNITNRVVFTGDVNAEGVSLYELDGVVYTEGQIKAMINSEGAATVNPVQPEVIDVATKVQEQNKSSQFVPMDTKLKDNTKMLDAFPGVKPIYDMYINHGYDVDIKSERGLVRFIPYQISNDMYAEDLEIYIDDMGGLYNKTRKIIIPAKGVNIEECYMFKADKLDILEQYLNKTLNIETLEAHQEISDDLKSFNKIVDIATLPTNSKERDAMIKNIDKHCQEELKEAIKNDPKARFRLESMKNQTNYRLISDSSIRTSILGSATVRTTQLIEVTNGKAKLVLEPKTTTKTKK